MTSITAAARQLSNNLQNKQISIKHVQALDLLAAGAGLANRHVLATMPELPSIKRVNIALLTSAATVLARYDLPRRKVIFDETSTVLLPETPAAEEASLIELENHTLRIYPHELGDPYQFLRTQRGAAFIGNLVDSMYYSRYCTYQSNRPLTLERGNSLAEKILMAKRAPEDPSWSRQGRVIGAIGKYFNFGESPEHYWFSYARKEVSQTLDIIANEIDDLEIQHGDAVLTLDLDDWMSELEDIIIEHLSDADTSKPTDWLGPWDKCEVLFLLKPDGYVMDQMISSNRTWSDFADLHVGPELQHGLSALGYNMQDYRKLSGNRNEGEGLKRGLKKRTDPLVTPAQLKELVDNACSQYFLFAVYAVVPVTTLIDLDLDKPITFSQAAIATYNPYDGTFHDVINNNAITINPKDGDFVSGEIGYSPDNIVGLHLPAYYATLTNPVDADEPQDQPLPLAA